MQNYYTDAGMEPHADGTSWARSILVGLVQDEGGEVVHAQVLRRQSMQNFKWCYLACSLS